MSKSILLRIAAVAALALPTTAGADTVSSGPDAPMVEIASPMDGAGYPQGYNLVAGYGCWSNVSTVISCEGSAPLGAQLDTSIAGTKTFTVIATDYEGRTTTATATYTIIDITPPTALITAPAEGAEYELGTGVTVDFECQDESGPTMFCAGQLPDGAPLDTSHFGASTFYVDAVDGSGNYARTTVHYSVVDHTPPTIALRTPANGATYTLGSDVRADYDCSDNGPLLSCAGTVGRGMPLDTSSVGTKTFSVTAMDKGRNETAANATYRVVYDFSGFFAPIASPLTQAKAGDTVPVKFSLAGDRGLDVFAPRSPAWRPAPCSGPSTTTDSSVAAGRLAYQAQSQRYTFYWATDSAWTGSCKELVVRLGDGSVHTARFQFTK